MNLIYGALLLHSAGKAVTEEGIKKLVDATGEKVDEMQIKALAAALEGVSIADVISKAAMPVASPVAAVAPPEAKKEEVSEEEKEAKAEQAAAGLSALFG